MTTLNTPLAGDIVLTLAHPGKRFQGQFIDGLITLFLLGVCITIQQFLGLEGDITDVFIIMIPAAYFLFADALPNGQSLAKRLLHIKVVHTTTLQPCTLWQSFLRNFFTPILGILDAVFIFTKDRKRVGDYLALTTVVIVHH
jgi:uncharacterized RDD family membrane protein YckC